MMHETKIVRFDWSVVSESFWYQMDGRTDRQKYIIICPIAIA